MACTYIYKWYGMYIYLHHAYGMYLYLHMVWHVHVYIFTLCIWHVHVFTYGMVCTCITSFCFIFITPEPGVE